MDAGILNAFATLMDSFRIDMAIQDLDDPALWMSCGAPVTFAVTLSNCRSPRCLGWRLI
jgi:hypothetical protein